MKELINPIVPQSLQRWLDHLVATSCGTHLRISYAQEGEDLLLERLFDGKKSGFYVDVGAHDPRRFSNTLRFYKVGWSGINIEPKSNDWARFRPTYVLVESPGFDLSNPGKEPIHMLLQQQHYDLFAKTLNTFFYVDHAADSTRGWKPAS